jgi:hypothetical protein
MVFTHLLGDKLKVSGECCLPSFEKVLNIVSIQFKLKTTIRKDLLSKHTEFINKVYFYNYLQLQLYLAYTNKDD